MADAEKKATEDSIKKKALEDSARTKALTGTGGRGDGGTRESVKKFGAFFFRIYTFKCYFAGVEKKAKEDADAQAKSIADALQKVTRVLGHLRAKFRVRRVLVNLQVKHRFKSS